MADTEVKASLSEPDQLTDTPVVAQRAELEVEQSKHGQVKLNETTVRTHTIIVGEYPNIYEYTHKLTNILCC